MAIVPTAQPTQTLQPLSGERVQPADFASGAVAVGQAAAALGQTGEQYAAAIDQRQGVIDEAGAKRLALDHSLLTEATLHGDGQNSPGYLASLGSDALNNRAVAEQAVRDSAASAMSQATDPRMRAFLGPMVMAHTTDALKSIGEHAQQQSIIYDTETHNARLSNLSNVAINNSGDPDQFGKVLSAISAETIDYALKRGMPPAQVIQEKQKATDGVYEGVVQKMAVEDPLGAKNFLNLHRDVISPATQQKLDTQLESHVDTAEAINAAKLARGDMPGPSSIQPVPLDPNATPYFQATKQVESAGRNGAVSPKGALGTMQVMPDTAKAICAKLGIPFDAARLQNDPAYCDRIGRAVQAENLQRYQGNATLATAAYNAGPAVVDDWRNGTNVSGKNASGLKIGDPLKGEVTDAQFAAKIPFKETRDYVPMVLGATQRFSGVTTAPVPPGGAPPLAQQEATIKNLHLRPDVEMKALQEVHRMDATDQRSINDAQKTAYDNVLPLLSNPNVKNVTDLPLGALQAMGPEHAKVVMSALDHNAKGVDAAPNPRLMLQMTQAATSDPVTFAHTDLTSLVGKLPNSDLNQLQTMQKQTLQAGGAATPKSVAYGHIGEVTRDIMNAAGLRDGKPVPGVPTAPPSPAGSPMAQRILDFHNGVAADVEAYHQTNGKYPTDDIIRSMAMKRTTQVTLPGSGGMFGLSPDNTALLGELPPNTRYQLNGASVPPTARAAIIAASQRAGRGMPTDAMIAHAYLHAGQ